MLFHGKWQPLNKQLQKSDFASHREPIERQIAVTNKEIDELIYLLYGIDGGGDKDCGGESVADVKSAPTINK